MSGQKTRRGEGEGWALVRECPRCSRKESDCRCSAAAASPGGRPVVRLRLEKRKGKPVTVCAAEGLGGDELRALAKELKTACGTGGTVKVSELELQGDRREQARDLFTKRGCRVKG